MSRPRRAPVATKKRRTSASRAQTFVLGAECTLADARKLYTRLKKLVTSRAPVRIDAGKVRRIDTANVQILTAFVRDRRAAGRPVEWLAAAAPVTDAARLLGLEAMLELPTAQEARS